jgi:integrase
MPEKLTEKRIRSLKTTQAQIEILHSLTPSAGIRITKDGRKTFFLIYRSPETGKQKRHSFGYHPSGRKGPGRAPETLSPMTLQEFERAYEIFRGELAKGRDPKGAPLHVDGLAPKWIGAESLAEDLRAMFPEGVIEGTVGALLAEYFTHARNQLAPRSYKGYRAAAKTYLLSRYAKIPLSLFTEEDVRLLLSEVTKRAPQMVREVKKVLSCAFTYGKAHVPGVKVNPCLGVPVTVPKGKRDRWLTEDELITFFQTLPKMNDPKAADCYLLMLSSLCRPSEAASARAEDLILMNGERVWRIPDTKNGRDFLVPLQGPIAEILLRRSMQVGGKGPLFWKYNADRDYPDQLTDANRNFRELAGLENVRPHDWRRTGRTHLSSLGVREEVAEAVMNHCKEDLKRVYNLYEFWPERKDALRLWHEKLERLRAEAITRAA